MNTLYIIQHQESTPPGTLLDWAKSQRIHPQIVRIDKGELLPSVVTVSDGVVVLGGSMDTYEIEKYPWIEKEKQFITELLYKNIPLLGICLGSQLLGECVGAKVSKNPVWEIGWLPVCFTQSIINSEIINIPVAHFHRFRVEPNLNIQVIATSLHCDVQAFYVKNKRALGIQFHPEADSSWFGNFTYPPAARVNEINVQSKESILSDGKKFELKAREFFFELLSKHFLQL
jgi:GMP synthase-like glutamine amidotransferase